MACRGKNGEWITVSGTGHSGQAIVAPVVQAPGMAPHLIQPEFKLGQQWVVGPTIQLQVPPPPPPQEQFIPVPPNFGHYISTGTNVVDIGNAMPGTWVTQVQQVVQPSPPPPVPVIIQQVAPAPAPVQQVYITTTSPPVQQALHPSHRKTVTVNGMERFVVGQDNNYVRNDEDGMLWLHDTQTWVNIGNQ